MKQETNDSKLKMHSPDLTQENIAKLAELFPNCVTEAQDEQGKLKQSIDFDQLRQELSDHIVEGPQERYHLNWPGKKEALLAANAPIAKTLRPCREESVDFDTTENLFIEGDNLDALKLLQETYLNKVKVIYIDPPYNTGNDFIYNDDYIEKLNDFLQRTNQKDEQGTRLIANPESNGRFHSNWLTLMYPRLRLARNLLRDDGVIFISIDDNELANMRKVCDEIFGNENFRNTFITRRYDKNLNRQFIDSGLQTLNVGFEYIIAYSKSNKFLFNPVYKEAEEKRQSTGYWKGFWNAADRPTMRYPLLGVEPSEGQWKWKKETAYEAVENYERYMEKFSHKMSLEEYWDQTGKVLKFIKRNKNGSGRNLGVEHWVPPSSGVLRNTNLLDILASKSTEEIKNLFDFPKNIELLKVLLMFSSKEDDLVMDFFAGSCSFAHATLELNKEDSNKRKFIMVQLPEPCGDTTEAKKSGCETIAEIGKERLRRVIYRIKGENSKSNRGLGFRVLHVDSSNMKNVYYTPDKITKRDLFGLVDNIKKDRTDEDLLFQVLLDWGVDLTLPIQSESISGKKVFFVDQDALAACFEPNLDEEFIKMLAERKPLRAVFRDSGFGSDSTKINLEQIFKLISPNTDVKTI